MQTADLEDQLDALRCIDARQRDDIKELRARLTAALALVDGMECVCRDGSCIACRLETALRGEQT